MDLKKFKSWTPASGEPANIEYSNKLFRSLKKWQSTIVLGASLGLVFAACYAVIIYPMNNSDDYRVMQEKNRKGINQEDIQPGGMRVWTDPFQRKK
ncbi:small integral membrane protein 20-like [Watersipora subatra]|uniref:small integral membrane protein 20-like n=1 Tax=Watersipora subatra TaxID=2589382 RepID=UPI00355B2E62